MLLWCGGSSFSLIFFYMNHFWPWKYMAGNIICLPFFILHLSTILWFSKGSSWKKCLLRMWSESTPYLICYVRGSLPQMVAKDTWPIRKAEIIIYMFVSNPTRLVHCWFGTNLSWFNLFFQSKMIWLGKYYQSPLEINLWFAIETCISQHGNWNFPPQIINLIMSYLNLAFSLTIVDGSWNLKNHTQPSTLNNGEWNGQISN